ncbi:MAG: DUF368 domain-containing protein [Bacteroidales bacterium]|nr:DUF368 domain-containing protein [Bacteroidales bacterium]
MKRKFKEYILVTLKGMGMGAADVVPGVSGGTIAFITGIYEELIHSIKSIDARAVRLFFTGRWRDFWKHVNGNFLLALFAGIFISVGSLAKVLEVVLERYPVMIWSFFFGLILASSYVVSKRIKKWDFNRAVALAVGIGIAFYITSVTPAETTGAWWFVIFSGMLASCAMILPGISGSFILLLLGKYVMALNAVNTVDVAFLLLLGAGAVIGLISFSNLLSWLLKKYHDSTIALLAGFMIGSLNKIWPWKETLETVVVDGHVKPLVEKNILPDPGNPGSFFWLALLMAAAGILLTFAIELLASRSARKNEKKQV